MKTAGIIILFIGLLIGGLTGRALYNKNKLTKTGIKAIGTVIRFETHESTSTSSGSGRKRTTHTTMYAPVVQFKDMEGKDHELTSSVSSSSKGYELGENIPVYYPVNKPEAAELSTTAGNIMTIVGIVIGALLTIGGGALLMKRSSHTVS